ncbi:peptidase M20 (plasmid) [Deinococcus aetherius]|uniref:Peptidase M20 n=1 Tax=Deinococcus aetherius TaxID=200252 RepID=A0ABM8AJK2_9DEIO|nr:dipeptidase [Deinococcus aetherius]BDP44012.1 peptidase M20 [Deinococcus aetherius]
MEDVLAYLEGRKDASLADLLAFASIPSVSTDPERRGDVRRAAEWLAGRLRTAGLSTVDILETPGHPVVYAEWLGAPDAPTVLVYGHYDVQPPDPLDRWQSPPFTPTVRGERVHGRGVSDDKGPLLIPVQVAEAFFQTRGTLPLNVKFLFEGEEEVGSPNLAPFVRAQAGRLRADVVLSADGGMWRADVPTLTVSSRGLAGLELTLRGPGKDLHSGRHGGAVQNPLHALASLLAGLHDERGRVTVDGFYDDVQELSDDERASLRALPFDEEAYRAEVGAPALFGEAGSSALERLWTHPTLEVNGMWGGYTGEGSKTVLPSEAHAKITCRLVANQDPERVTEAVVRHLETHLPPGVTLDVRPSDHGARAYRIPADHPALLAARKVLTQVYGQPPLEVGMGGSIPICEVFQRELGLETVFFSFAVGDEDIHAPNEFFRIPRLYEGQRAWARLWQELAVREVAPV